MSIPDRLFRLAKGKIGEIREMFDNQDEEIDPELIARIERSQARKSAKDELSDALDGTVPAKPSTSYTATPVRPSPTYTAPPVRPSSGLRSPEEIRGGSPMQTNNVNPGDDDRLADHYRLLGLEPGSDYATVQAVYEKLLSRCLPDRFPAGSPEALEAKDIQARLEATYKVLREELDPTARRFEMLEI